MMFTVQELATSGITPYSKPFPMDASSISNQTTPTMCHVWKHELRKANRNGTRRGSFLVRWILDIIVSILNLWALKTQVHCPLQTYFLDSSGNRNTFGSYFSFKSLLVNQDKKKSKPRMHRKDKNTEKQFPKNIQIKDVQTEFDGFFPPHCKHCCCRRLRLFLTNTFVGPASSQHAWIWTRLQKTEATHLTALSSVS